MPPTEITEITFMALCAECRDAIAVGDWPTAWSKYLQAEAENAALLARLTQGSVDKTRRNDLGGLRKAIEAGEAHAISRTTQRGRMVRTSMGY